MTIEVTGPDHTIHEFPDGTSNDVIKGVMAKAYGAPKAEPGWAAKADAAISGGLNGYAQKPGMGRFAMRGGRRSGERKTIAGQVVRRTTGAERHAAMLASRALRDADGNPIGVWVQP